MTAERDLLKFLRHRGHIRTSQARLIPLTGGVSSELFVVDDSGEKFVVKRALPQLRVADEWLANPQRNENEKKCLEFLKQIAPANVPAVIFHEPEESLFGMEYFGGEFQNWKNQLLAGLIRAETAHHAGRLMGLLHSRSWGDAAVERSFATTDNFRALRLEPYLMTTGMRTPPLRECFFAEAARLEQTRIALVHGDFSPKNLLVGPDRLILLDCEAAWCGDPAFDAAFLLNHLFLKALHRPQDRAGYSAAVDAFLEAYEQGLTDLFDDAFAERIGRLLLMLLLARVDGKSPVEYLVDCERKNCVRAFVRELLPSAVFDLPAIRSEWLKRISQL